MLWDWMCKSNGKDGWQSMIEIKEEDATNRNKLLEHIEIIKGLIPHMTEEQAHKLDKALLEVNDGRAQDVCKDDN